MMLIEASLFLLLVVCVMLDLAFVAFKRCGCGRVCISGLYEIKILMRMICPAVYSM